MAIDVRQTRNEKLTRCKYYAPEYVNNNKLTQNAECSGIFYAKDSVPFSKTSIAMGNALITQITGEISTNDYVPSLSNMWYVDYGGDLYLVESVVIDDANKTKQFSSRPASVTTIRLRR